VVRLSVLPLTLEMMYSPLVLLVVAGDDERLTDALAEAVVGPVQAVGADDGVAAEVVDGRSRRP
jgi:hypothetical protein